MRLEPLSRPIFVHRREFKTAAHGPASDDHVVVVLLSYAENSYVWHLEVSLNYAGLDRAHLT